jgi:hypothetical protein
MKILSCIALLFASLIASSEQTVTDCGAGKSVFQIQSQGFYPEPPVANEPYDYWFYYTVPEGVTVDAGTVKYSLSLNGIPFAPSTDDLCTQTSCPKTPGSYNETSKDTWPSGISGKIVTKLEWFDSAGTLLVCSQTTERV